PCVAGSALDDGRTATLTLPREAGVMAKATLGSRSSKSGQQNKRKTAPRRARAASNGGKRATGFTERKSIAKLAAEQGIRPTRLEDILGKGADFGTATLNWTGSWRTFTRAAGKTGSASGGEHPSARHRR